MNNSERFNHIVGAKNQILSLLAWISKTTTTGLDHLRKSASANQALQPKKRAGRQRLWLASISVIVLTSLLANCGKSEREEQLVWYARSRPAQQQTRGRVMHTFF